MAKCKIPKILHQSYHSKILPDAYLNNIEHLKKLNPEWEHYLYDDHDALDFIRDNYGNEMLDYYNKINPKYGAARADLFRYLLIYKKGGVWLDIKSSASAPFHEVLESRDTFIVSQWQNRKGEAYQGAGLHAELQHVTGGEFQQWHIISSPGNPLIESVISKVLHNIDNYSPRNFGAGRKGTLITTGPIAYTKAIAPLLSSHEHRRVDAINDLKLIYSIFEKNGHYSTFRSHYSTLSEPIVINGNNRFHIFQLWRWRKEQRRISKKFIRSLRQ